MTEHSLRHQTPHELPASWVAMNNVTGFLVAALKKGAELEAHNKELAHQNTHDDLTGLLNKKAWKQALEARMQRNEAFGIAFVDLDGFKRVNDRLGHDRGDKLLSDFGAFLEDKFQRKQDTIAHEPIIENDEGESAGRYGGDEFVFAFGLTANNRRSHDIHENMDREYEYLNGILHEFVEIQPDDVKACDFNASIGVAVYDPVHPVDATTLLKQADEAMYEEKTERNGAR